MRCGIAYLYRQDVGTWRLADRIERPETDDTSNFGQTVGLLPDGSVMIGGAGLAGGPGRLHLFERADDQYRVAAVLEPAVADDTFFATDPTVSGDGRWMAVAESQRVSLWRRDAMGITKVQDLEPPAPTAGYFGEVLALSHDGTTLVAGAPGSTCQRGKRCGAAYLYKREDRTWQLVGTLRRRPEKKGADFGYRAAVDASGSTIVLQGADIIQLTRE